MNEAKQTFSGDHQDLEFPDDLTLQWMYAEAFGYKLMGSKGEPFALQTQDGSVFFMGSPEERVKTTYIFQECPEVILKAIQKLKGNFWVEDDEVICRIGSAVASGPDYMRAGMLAFAKYKGQ